MTDLGPERWRAPVRSWSGVAAGGLLVTPALANLVVGEVAVFGLLLLAGGLVLLVPSALARVAVHEHGVEVWPFRTRLRWDAVESFEATGVLLGNLRAYRAGVTRPAPLTVQPIGVGRARDLADRLNAELDWANRTS